MQVEAYRRCPFRSLSRSLPRWLLAATLVTGAIGGAAADDRDEFVMAWQAASRGDRATFQRIKPTLTQYLLYPYLLYEDLRARRSTADSREMAGFLDAHQDWAFTAGLRTAWLRALGKNRSWEDLARYAGEVDDTIVRCHLAHARIRLGQVDGLLGEVQTLWLAGRSQPDECDPAFDWLRKQNGITAGLAWRRIALVIENRNSRMVRYLSRYLPADERKWADQWVEQERSGYRRLDKAVKWTDAPQGRDIARYGLRVLARSNPDHAALVFDRLDGHFSWSAAERGGILREIALWSAVERSTHTGDRVMAVPVSFRTGQVLEWWARFGMATGDWSAVTAAIGQMAPELSSDGRWRYWDARANLSLGDPGRAETLLDPLSREATYHGFLAADLKARPYTICPQQPPAGGPAPAGAGFERALELRRAGLKGWARAEWQLATTGLDRDGLRRAAALAVSEGWHEMAIFALGDSGDLNWYEWRFPLHHLQLVEQAIGRTLNQTQPPAAGIDPSWVLGLMRSESAMAEDAISSAGARGLMQLMPATAQRMARMHGLNYTGKQQLLRADDNIRIGTLYLASLLDEFGGNPVLATGAYNAGPGPVRRWVDELPGEDATVWVETLSYFETRDYIPRVLAFSTIYDWRMNRPVRRVTSRMPKPGSGSIIPVETTPVVCPAS